MVLSGNGVPADIGVGAISSACNVFVMANGDVLVADCGADEVWRIPLGTGTPISIGSGWSSPNDVFATANGDIWVVDNGNDQVKVLLGGVGTPQIFAATFNRPWSVFVTTNGDVYVSEKGSSMVKWFPGGDASAEPILVCSGFPPYGIFVTANGDVYVADPDVDAAVKKIPGGNGTVVIVAYLPDAYDVSVTAAGDVYMLANTNSPNAVTMLPGGNATAAVAIPTSGLGSYARGFFIDGTIASGEA